MIRNQHNYTIYCQPEVSGYVISGGNAKTIEAQVVVAAVKAAAGADNSIKRKHYRFKRKQLLGRWGRALWWIAEP